jgi:hypothetical protein
VTETASKIKTICVARGAISLRIIHLMRRRNRATATLHNIFAIDLFKGIVDASASARVV